MNILLFDLSFSRHAWWQPRCSPAVWYGNLGTKWEKERLKDAWLDPRVPYLRSCKFFHLSFRLDKCTAFMLPFSHGPCIWRPCHSKSFYGSKAVGWFLLREQRRKPVIKIPWAAWIRLFQHFICSMYRGVADVKGSWGCWTVKTGTSHQGFCTPNSIKYVCPAPFFEEETHLLLVKMIHLMHSGYAAQQIKSCAY